MILESGDYDELLGALVRVDLAGGAVYDGLIGATARRRGAKLLSLDVRARLVYGVLDVDVGWLIKEA